MKTITLEQATEILRTRAAKLLPTAPLHSDGYDVGGYDPKLYVGWKYSDKKLAEEYQKHIRTGQSRLSKILGEELLDKFIKGMEKQLEDLFEDRAGEFLAWLEADRKETESTPSTTEQGQGEEDEEESNGGGEEEEFEEDGPGIVDSLPYLCPMVYLRLLNKDLPIRRTSREFYPGGDEASQFSIDGLIIGDELDVAIGGSISLEELTKAFDETKKKLLAIPNLPSFLKPENIKVIMDGDYSSGQCY